MTKKTFIKSQKNTLWIEYCGNNDSCFDIFGREMSRNNFEADHILPKSKGGRTRISNGLPLHPDSNKEKADYLYGYVNGHYFVVKINSDGDGEIEI